MEERIESQDTIHTWQDLDVSRGTSTSKVSMQPDREFPEDPDCVRFGFGGARYRTLTARPRQGRPETVGHFGKAIRKGTSV